MAINYYKKKDNELKDKNTANPWQVSVYGLGFEKQEEVQVPRNTALVDGLSDEDIAKFLDVPVVAEGVEDEVQVNTLKKMGCDVIQGFYFSKPVPPEEFERFIAG